MFFKVKVVKVSKKLKNEDLIGREFFLFCTKKKAYKIGKKNEQFDFEYFIQNNILVGKSICTCTEKDCFITKIPLKTLEKNKFLVKSVILKQHDNEASPYKINEYVILEFIKDTSIKTKKDALLLYSKSKIRKGI